MRSSLICLASLPSTRWLATASHLLSQVIPSRPGPVCGAASRRWPVRPLALSRTCRIQKLGEEGVYDCKTALPQHGNNSDRPLGLDYEGPHCAGAVRDPFPSTTVYVIATFVDPQALYWDPEQQIYVFGPLASKVFYQFAGTRVLPQARN